MAAATAEVQALLRFLTQDAKVPLAGALAKTGEMRKAKLNNAENIAKANVTDIKSIFTDEKLAKQIWSAAKRVSNPKKRKDPHSTAPSLVAKRVKSEGNPEDVEAKLELPATELGEDELTEVTIQTNRAPLVLAFAVILLQYTMPEQPLSSRLSLAQAVVSANSQSKAKSIGLKNDSTAEDEGWGQGQPKVRVMGREIAVMRRAIHQPADTAVDDNQTAIKGGGLEDFSKTENEEISPQAHSSFWGLDLEALRKSNGPLIAGKNATGHTGLPIHAPQAARSYMLRSFTVLDKPAESKTSSSKKSAAADAAAKKEHAAAMLFQALHLLYTSWASTLTSQELDRRAWSWYVHVRPEVAQGQSGWGQKGELRLADILKLRKDP